MMTTYIGGNAEAIAAVVGDPQIEALPVTVDDAIAKASARISTGLRSLQLLVPLSAQSSNRTWPSSWASVLRCRIGFGVRATEVRQLPHTRQLTEE